MQGLERSLAAGAFAALAVGVQAADGSGLTVSPDDLYWPRWQTRMSVLPAPASTSLGGPVKAAAASSLGLMSDYYMTGSLLGPRRAGGFRATSGVVIGPRAQAWTLGGGSAWGAERRGLGPAPVVLPGDSTVETATLPYLGVGYTGLSARGGWSFSADLGVMSLAPSGAVKLGKVFNGSQSLDDTLRDMRWSPVLQLGVSYSF